VIAPVLPHGAVFAARLGLLLVFPHVPLGNVAGLVVLGSSNPKHLESFSHWSFSHWSFFIRGSVPALRTYRSGWGIASKPGKKDQIDQPSRHLPPPFPPSLPAYRRRLRSCRPAVLPSGPAFPLCLPAWLPSFIPAPAPAPAPPSRLPAFLPASAHPPAFTCATTHPIASAPASGPAIPPMPSRRRLTVSPGRAFKCTREPSNKKATP
jgi:hypothetical protein